MPPIDPLADPLADPLPADPITRLLPWPQRGRLRMDSANAAAAARLAASGSAGGAPSDDEPAAAAPNPIFAAAAAAAVIGVSSISPECSLKLSDDPESVAILNAKRLLL